jgi:hypothetical protein
MTSGSSIIVSVQNTDVNIGLRHGPKSLAADAHDSASWCDPLKGSTEYKAAARSAPDSGLASDFVAGANAAVRVTPAESLPRA